MHDRDTMDFMLYQLVSECFHNWLFEAGQFLNLGFSIRMIKGMFTLGVAPNRETEPTVRGLTRKYRRRGSPHPDLIH